MDPSLYIAFLGATVLLMLLPGPNVALIVATSLSRGTRSGLLTVAGTSAAMVPQLALVGLGLSVLLETAGAIFEIFRWIGVAYLAFLAARQWFAPSVHLTEPAPLPPRTIFFRGFFVSLTNPKTLFFFGTFFPPFISPARPHLPQIVILAGTFLALAVLIDGSWALLAARARSLLARSGRLPNRLSAVLLLGAAAGLALARRRPA
jgi:threonine/homoserine/homoserine lactone efflux protein